MTLRFVFQNPILAGQSGVEDAVLNVARHLLRADQHALDFLIIDGGKIRTRADTDFIARATKKLQRGFLQASFGQSQLQQIHVWLSGCVW